MVNYETWLDVRRRLDNRAAKPGSPFGAASVVSPLRGVVQPSEREQALRRRQEAVEMFLVGIVFLGIVLAFLTW